MLTTELTVEKEKKKADDSARKPGELDDTGRLVKILFILSEYLHLHDNFRNLYNKFLYSRGPKFVTQAFI